MPMENAFRKNVDPRYIVHLILDGAQATTKILQLKWQLLFCWITKWIPRQYLAQKMYHVSSDAKHQTLAEIATGLSRKEIETWGSLSRIYINYSTFSHSRQPFYPLQRQIMPVRTASREMQEDSHKIQAQPSCDRQSQAHKADSKPETGTCRQNTSQHSNFKIQSNRRLLW